MSAALASSPTTYKAIVHAEADGRHWAEVAGLPGCFTQGDTLDDLYRNLAEAIASHLGLEIPAVLIGLLEMAA